MCAPLFLWSYLLMQMFHVIPALFLWIPFSSRRIPFDVDRDTLSYIEILQQSWKEFAAESTHLGALWIPVNGQKWVAVTPQEKNHPEDPGDYTKRRPHSCINCEDRLPYNPPSNKKRHCQTGGTLLSCKKSTDHRLFSWSRCEKKGDVTKGRFKKLAPSHFCCLKLVKNCCPLVN